MNHQRRFFFFASRRQGRHPLFSYRHYKLKESSRKHIPNTQLTEVNVPQLKVLTPLQRQLSLGFARCAFQSQHNLLCRLGSLVENRLGLTTISRLFAVITALSLGEERSLEGKTNGFSMKI
jgi:hypothetical protein